jgi:zinc transport system permease protein
MTPRFVLRGAAMLDDFLTRAAVAGVGAAVLAAPLGCFVVWRRMAYFGETVAYSGLLGVALGFLLGIDLTLGVIATAIAMALLLTGFQTQRAIPYDTLLGILAHVALAAGVIAASFAGGARLDLMGYLFGDILAVSKADIAWIWGGAAAVLAALFFLWRPLLAVTVNEELAAAEGVPVRRTETAFILLIAVTVALAMKVIGILLITSLMIFPTAVARPFSKTPEQMAALAGVAAAAAVLGGLYLSLRLDTAAGPSIVLALAALFFFVAAPVLALRGRKAGSIF